MSEKKEKICATCRFFAPWDKVAGTNWKKGGCRRRPPVQGVYDLAYFPTVPEHYWCGEYEEKDEA